jgi:hydrogenase nickel incorporation protein HypA/HybF
MHEISLAKTLLERVDRLAAEHAAAAVEEVRVRVGPLSGVEPGLLSAAFERLAPAGMKLAIELVPLRACCRDCAGSFDIERCCFRCPRCGSTDVEVVEGDGFVLENITIRPLDPLGAVP